MKHKTVYLTALLATAPAYAQTIQSGTTGGMPYQVLMPSTPCSASAPCGVVTYLGYQDATYGDATTALSSWFAPANMHDVVIAPTIAAPQDAVTNWGGYNRLNTPEQAQMIAVVQGVEQQMGNTVNPANSVVTGGSLGGTGTQAALVAAGPKGLIQPGVFSAGLSFDAALWTANSDSAQIAALCGVPLMAVHGSADTNQSITYDQNLQSAVNSNPSCGNSFKLVTVNGAGHGTWAGASGYPAGSAPGTPLAYIAAATSSGGSASGGLVGAGASTAATPAATAPPTTSTAPPPPTVISPAAPSTSSSAQITPGQGSVTDCHGNTWTINSENRILENGQPVLGGGDTSALQVVGCTVYGLSNGRNGSIAGWFTLNGSNWVQASAPTSITAQPSARASAALAAPAAQNCPGNTAGNGGFHVAGGQIIGPDGNPWIARGINVYSSSDGASNPAAITATFTGLNFVRYIVRSLNDPSSFDAFANAMTSQGRVVEFEDHPDGGGGQDAAPPQGIPAESAWYAAMAKHFSGNPYVWFGTFNEPASTSALSAWQQATYNAIRGAGNNSPILVEVSGSRPYNLQQALTPGTYSSMTNIIWDVHVYPYQNNYNSDPTSITDNINGMITAAQTITSADGLVPVIIGESGPSTTGSSLDPNGYATVEGLANVASAGKMGGLAPFTWYPGFSSPNNITDAAGNPTSPYGQMVQLYVNTDVVPLSSCQATARAQQQIATVTAQIAAAAGNPSPSQGSAPETAQQPASANVPNNPVADALNQSATASIAQANAIMSATQQQMQTPQAGQ